MTGFDIVIPGIAMRAWRPEMTRKELAEQVNLAYDRYFDAIQELGTAAGIMPPSPRLVEADPRRRSAPRHYGPIS